MVERTDVTTTSSVGGVVVWVVLNKNPWATREARTRQQLRKQGKNKRTLRRAAALHRKLAGLAAKGLDTRYTAVVCMVLVYVVYLGSGAPCCGTSTVDLVGQRIWALLCVVVFVNNVEDSAVQQR